MDEVKLPDPPRSIFKKILRDETCINCEFNANVTYNGTNSHCMYGLGLVHPRQDLHPSLRSCYSWKKK